MPELPEVETVTKALNIAIKNFFIKKVIIYRSDLRITTSKNMKNYCEGARILYVKRRGKFGKIYLDNSYIIVFHLGMSGRIIIDNNPSFQKKKHDHIFFKLKSAENKNYTSIIYNDPRRFGFISVYRNNSGTYKNIFINLGPEPLSNRFNADALHVKLRNRSVSIKAALLNQRLVAGLGNIYVCEALFLAFMSPTKRASSLSKKKIISLVCNIKRVLIKAIELGGSTIQDHKNINGEIGYFQNYFLVYGRERMDCKNKNCKTKIKRIIQNGRSTFYCPSCQR